MTNTIHLASGPAAATSSNSLTAAAIEPAAPAPSTEAVLQKEWIHLESRGHSSGIVKGPEGMIVVTSGRTDKTEPKSILIYREKGGKWTKETLYTPSQPGEFCSSPVICPAMNGYLLFFLMGTQRDQDHLHGQMLRSVDGGVTFTAEALPEGIIGPTKCKPLQVGRYLVFGSSFAEEGKKKTAAKIEVYDTVTGTWHQSPELNGENDFGAIEPTFCTFKENGETCIRMLCRNRSKGFALTAVFTLPNHPEEGFKWPAKLIDSTLPNCDSGLDIVDLSGKVVGEKVIPEGTAIAFGNFLGNRSTLEMSVSSNGGNSWSAAQTIEAQSGEFPAAIFDDATGMVHVAYASKVPNNAPNKDAHSMRHFVLDPRSINL